MCDPPLGILHLLANFVTQYLVPVDLCACDGKLPTQSLKGGVGHGLIVLTDCSLKANKKKKREFNVLFSKCLFMHTLMKKCVLNKCLLTW